MQQYFISYFQQHLEQLKKEINAYEREQDLWIIAPGISNSAGNLCYHLTGNLNHYIGAALGNTGYERDRPLEFSIKDVPRAELVRTIDETSVMIENVLSKVNDLEAEYPEDFFSPQRSIAHYLFRLITHFNYHLGQINYHRRILTTK